MAQKQAGGNAGLTILAVPGTLATTLPKKVGTDSRSDPTVDRPNRLGEREVSFSMEEEGLANPQSDQTENGDPSGLQKVLGKLVEQQEKENSKAINWYDEGCEEIPTTIAPNLIDKDNIRKLLKQTQSVADALKFLRVRANAGIQQFPVNVECVEWATPNDVEAHIERQQNGEASAASKIVGGGNNAKARGFGRKKLSEAIERLEKEQRKYIIIGHSHGGTVGVRALRRRAAHSKKLAGFMGAIYVGTPEVSTRVRLLKTTLIGNNIMSPTIRDALVTAWLFSAVLVARLLGLYFIADAFPMDAPGEFSLDWFKAQAPISTSLAVWSVTITAGVTIGILLLQQFLNAQAETVDERLAKKAPQYFVNSPDDEIVNIFEDLSEKKLDDARDDIGETTNDFAERNKAPIVAGVTAWTVVNGIKKLLNRTAVLAIGVIALWSFISISGDAQCVLLALQVFGIEPNTEQELRSFLSEYFGDGIIPSLQGWAISGCLIALAAVLTLLNVFGVWNSLGDMFERTIAIGLLGLRESKVPRHETLKREAPRLEINKEPVEVFDIVTQLANARGANLMSHLRDMVMRKDAARNLRSAETLKVIRRMPAAQGLVHTSYFRSRLFKVYLAKLIAEMSGGFLTFPRENPKQGNRALGIRGDDYVSLDEVARLAYERDLETIVVDASTTKYSFELGKDRRLAKPDTASWAGEMSM